MTDEWLLLHQQKVSQMNFAIVNPWTDKGCYKTGLCEAYICNCITELLHISAELTPKDKLNNPNPIYHKLISLIKDLLKSQTDVNFNKVLEYIQSINNCKFSISKWSYQLGDVDIRALDTIEECLMFLKTFFIQIQGI
jgi:hypothetical protein